MPLYICKPVVAAHHAYKPPYAHMLTTVSLPLISSRVVTNNQGDHIGLQTYYSPFSLAP